MLKLFLKESHLLMVSHKYQIFLILVCLMGKYLLKILDRGLAI